jgi:steroid 5-alpha reductase family enzyme
VLFGHGRWIVDKDDKVALITIPIAVVIGTGFAWAGASVPVFTIGKYPVIWICIAAAFAIQWLAFIPAYIFKTEKFYDFTGSITYLSITLFAAKMNPHSDLRSRLIASFIAVWAIRLGFFLFARILKAGEDSRFANIRGKFLRFLMAWTLQGLWVTFSLAAGLTALTSLPVRMDIFGYVGAGLWCVGFLIEALADFQKSRFRRDESNKGRFISSGLWSWSRHPNYFGEIVLWTGIAVMAFPVLQGWQYATLVSPVFVTLLLTKISGIPLLEEAADKKWGGQKEYDDYKRRTSVLIPLPPRR